MDSAAARRLVRFCGLTTATAVLLSACETTPPLAATRNQVIISVRDQKLTVVKEDHTRVSFPISTSKFGLGDRRGTYETPTGELAVAAKIGDGAAPGSVFHGRVRTGEIVKVDAPGRDAIVTRILALRGLEANNSQAFSRGIYIHGTPEERNIGRPTSYGCIRMRSSDVIQLYNMIKVGARVQIIDTTQNQAIAANILQTPPGTPPPNLTAPAAGAPGTAVATSTATTTNKLTGTTAIVTSTTTTNRVTGATATTSTATTPKAAAAPAAPAKRQWPGTPTALLAKQNASEAKAKKPPVGAAPSARPVSNDSPATPSSETPLGRSMLDTL